MDQNPNTFCVAPWFQIRNENNMKKKVCCSISNEITEHLPSESMTSLDYLNSQPIVKLKQDLAAGVRNTHCKKCWINEKNNIVSLRQELNSFIGGKWVDAYFKNKTNYISDIVVGAQVNIGNTCNFACVMCNPEDSSLVYADWMKDLNHKHIQSILSNEPDYLTRVKGIGYKNKYFIDYLNDMITDNKHLKTLSFLGGEPFLHQMLLTKLRELPDSKKQKLSLQFITNGSKDFSDIVDSLGRFKYINCSVSLEGTGRVQEWARYGSDWHSVEKNILKAVDNPAIDVTILYTFQTATVLGFSDLAKWCRNHNIKLNPNIVYEPECLSVKTLPEHIKIELFKDIVNNKNIIDDTHTTYEDLLVKVNDLEYDQNLRSDFFSYIEWYESNKNVEKLKNIFPELYR